MLAESGGVIDEAYQGAVGSSNLRVGNDHTLSTPGDLVAAAGMNNHRLGLALLRLRTEWGSAARPTPPTADEITTLARSYPVEPPELRILIALTPKQIEEATARHGLEPAKLKAVDWRVEMEVPNPNAGKVKLQRDDRVDYVLPLKQAKRERWQWYEHEVKLVLMTMRSLPAIRDAILFKSNKHEWGCDEHAVASVLLWWLDPKCTACGGNQEDVVAGTGRTNGRKCPKCKGSGLERQGDPPLGKRGAQLAGHINACLQAARRELSEGIYRERRTLEGESRRRTNPV